MIKIQEEDFNSEDEINKIKKLYSNVGAVSSFIGYVRNENNNKKVRSINLEVYKEMAYKQFEKIINKANLKWKLYKALKEILTPLMINWRILKFNCLVSIP